MSQKIDKFCDDLRGHLNKVEARLSKTKQRIDASRKESRAAIEAKLGEAKASLDAQKQKVEEAKANAAKHLEEKKEETESKIQEWKDKHEQKKLDKRADRSESYAASCIMIAADAVDEADLAILEAIDARMAAEDFAEGH